MAVPPRRFGVVRSAAGESADDILSTPIRDRVLTQQDRRLQKMSRLTHLPLFVFAFSFVVMYLAARFGFFLRSRRIDLDENSYHDLDLVVAGTLTLLSLIIGFSFSMAVSRYDQRKNLEEAEANAIGTEYVRAGLLPAADAANVRALLREYLDQRVLFYLDRTPDEIQESDAKTIQLQNSLWLSVQAPALAQPNQLTALAAAGMNDVLNSQGYTQAAWWNRIPPGAWVLMVAVGICANLLIGFDSRRLERQFSRLLILPFVLCVAFFAIADIDSPRRGIIRVVPQNLISLAQSLQMQAQNQTPSSPPLTAPQKH